MTIDENNSEGFGEVTEREPSEETTEENTGSSEQEQTQETTEETADQTEEQGTQEKAEGQTQEPEFTEKGTKLDPNPQSRVHQELANERAKARQMEQVLSNPQLLSQYVSKQFGLNMTQQQAEAKAEEIKQEVKKYTGDDFTTGESVAEVVNKLQEEFGTKSKTYEEKIQTLEKTLQQTAVQNHIDKVSTNLANGISTLQKAPELNPKSPDFIEGLEGDIAELYEKLDIDPQTGFARGQYSIVDIGNYLLGTARRARQKGSLQAQTVVKDKSEGRVRTSTKVSEEADDSKMKPADSIAAGIAKTFGN